MGKEGGAPSISASGPSTSSGGGGRSFSSSSIASPGRSGERFFSAQMGQSSALSRIQSPFNNPDSRFSPGTRFAGLRPETRAIRPIDGLVRAQKRAMDSAPRLRSPEIQQNPFSRMPRYEAIKARSMEGRLPRGENPFGSEWRTMVRAPMDRFRSVTPQAVESNTTTGIGALDQMTRPSERPKGIFGARVQRRRFSPTSEASTARDQSVAKPAGKGIEGAKLYGERANSRHPRIFAENAAKAETARPAEVTIPKTGPEIKMPRYEVVTAPNPDRVLPRAERPQGSDWKVEARAHPLPEVRILSSTKVEAPQVQERPLIDRALGKPGTRVQKDVEPGIVDKELYAARNKNYGGVVRERVSRAQNLNQTESAHAIQQAKKPVILRPEQQNIQSLAELITEKAQSYARNINSKQVIEAAELAHAAYLIKTEGFSTEASQILVRAAVMKGIEVAQPEKLAERISSSPKWQEFKKNFETSKEKAKGQNSVKTGTQEAMSPKTEAVYKKLKAHPEVRRIVFTATRLQSQGLTAEQIQAQIITSQTTLTATETHAIAKAVAKRVTEIKKETKEKIEEEEKKKEPTKDEMIAELDPEAQAERMGYLQVAIKESSRDELGGIDSKEVAKRLPHQFSKPKIISEAVNWFKDQLKFNPQPDGSWPQAVKEIDAYGRLPSEEGAEDKLSEPLDRNIPIRWRMKSRQTQREASKKQIQLVYDQLADDVAREVAGSLSA
jgi:hypothetical protein